MTHPIKSDSRSSTSGNSQSSPAINRRDFLKLAGALPFGLYASQAARTLGLQTAPEKKNILIIVFDAFSAHNMSLYGYERQTTPNIDKLAERATVYHNHYSNSNFTTPGTASLLTGMLPWTTRALQLNGKVAESLARRNIFSVFDEYETSAYSHNQLVNTLFEQFFNDIEEWIPKEGLLLRSSEKTVQRIFRNDADISSVSWGRETQVSDDGFAYSLFLSKLISYLDDRNVNDYLPFFPRGVPTASGTGRFLLEHAINWIAKRYKDIIAPTLGYYHLLPPHAPYKTPGEFVGRFRRDGFTPIEKPRDIFATEEGVDFEKKRAYYDEYIMYVDREFARLYQMLEESGRLEDTWVVLTSDHGEMFERGISEHLTNVLYEPVIRIPLIIFEPGKSSRADVRVPTSAIDLLPTLAHLNGVPIPNWAEGTLLPPHRAAQDKSDVYAVHSVETVMGEAFQQGSIALVKDGYKLHYYFGYPKLQGQERVELYDLASDPEEMNDISSAKSSVTRELLAQVKAGLAQADKPYQK